MVFEVVLGGVVAAGITYELAFFCANALQYAPQILKSPFVNGGGKVGGLHLAFAADARGRARLVNVAYGLAIDGYSSVFKERYSFLVLQMPYSFILDGLIANPAQRGLLRRRNSIII